MREQHCNRGDKQKTLCPNLVMNGGPFNYINVITIESLLNENNKSRIALREQLVGVAGGEYGL